MMKKIKQIELIVFVEVFIAMLKFVNRWPAEQRCMLAYCYAKNDGGAKIGRMVTCLPKGQYARLKKQYVKLISFASDYAKNKTTQKEGA